MSWCKVMNIIFETENMTETNVMLMEINNQLKDYKIEFIGVGGLSHSNNDMGILKIGRK